MKVGRTRRLVITFAVLGFLAFGCSFAGYRVLESVNWWAPHVDPVALDAQVRAALPPGSTAEQALAWLRANGVADEHIRLIVRALDGVPTTSIYQIEGWYPQPHLYFRQPSRIVVRCNFGNNNRAEDCRANPDYGDLWEATGGGSLAIVTPPPR